MTIKPQEGYRRKKNGSSLCYYTDYSVDHMTSVSPKASWDYDCFYTFICKSIYRAWATYQDTVKLLAFYLCTVL